MRDSFAANRKKSRSAGSRSVGVRAIRDAESITNAARTFSLGRATAARCRVSPSSDGFSSALILPISVSAACAASSDPSG
ncbi:hypothetical protein LUW74_26155 [Actinomadura madurae]|uniref:hypothetical protein n=1 Tax=Actinomadura madurae TaxID=1993 RepID=UPI0020268188|nr:hypothetical protein [Actinomadura madurae]URN06464.1 hypothetical protein LUW74_26155 [Actinomadura madurae]